METLISIPSSTLSPILKPRSCSFSSSLCLSSSSSSMFNKSIMLKRNCSLVSRTRSSKVRKNMGCTCLFGLGVPELVVIAGVAALVFGPKKLPEVGRSIGKTVKSFQEAAKEFETELKKEPNSALDSPVEKSTEEEKEEIKTSSIKESL